MLAKEPSERPPDAATAWEELEELTIGLLGPRWRREARLVGPPRADGGPRLATTKPRDADRPTRAAAAPPTVARERRRRRGLLVIAALLLAGLAGLAVAVLPGWLDESTAREASGTTTGRTAPTTAPDTTTQAPATTQRPQQRAGAVVDGVELSRSGREVTARVAFTGAAPDAAGLQVPDGEIADGAARFVLWQQGVGYHVGRRAAEGLTVAVSGKPSRLVFDLAAAPGAFEAMSRPRVVGKTIEVTLTEPAPSVTTTPRDTTPAPPQEPQPTVSIG
jgi:hypothetical protein